MPKVWLYRREDRIQKSGKIIVLGGMLMKSKLYIYRMTNEGGFAPCIDAGMLTLSCCKGGWKNGVKTGIRYWIGKDYEMNPDKCKAYVMGIYKDNICYFAEITKVMKMTEYYRNGGLSKGRSDDIYYVKDGQLEHKGKEKPHNTKDDKERDKNGVYTLISDKDKFLYFGANNFPADEIKNILKNKYPLRQETIIVDDKETIERIKVAVKKNKNIGEKVLECGKSFSNRIEKSCEK